jgi:glutamyl-tRNA reductase
MLKFVVVGLNHRTAQLELRERAAFPAAELPNALERLANLPGIEEAMIISTCNRVELIARVNSNGNGVETLANFLSQERRIPPDQLEERIYRHTGRQAVRHLFRVASSLDSLVLGEPQILGQVKTFYGLAVDTATVGTYLNLLLQSAFRTAKRVRSETSIGEYSVSVSSAAVELARKIFGKLGQSDILIVGAGEMAELALRHLSSDGVKSIRVANRSPEAAERLAARFSGTSVPFTDLAHWLAASDIVITSTGSPDILITRALAQSVSRKRRNKPVIFIDISVPRNVDPGVASIENIFCYDIDDLGTIAEANLEERAREASDAEKIVDQEVEAFCARVKTQDVAPLIVELQDRIEELCQAELQRFMKRSGPRDEKEVRELNWMMSRIAGKIAHPLIAQLKNAHRDPLKREAYLDVIRRILRGAPNSEGEKPI